MQPRPTSPACSPAPMAMSLARFGVCAMNPARGNKYPLDAEELAQVAKLLGHPVRQVLAHY